MKSLYSSPLSQNSKNCPSSSDVEKYRIDENTNPNIRNMARSRSRNNEKKHLNFDLSD